MLTKEQKAERNKGIGGSDISVILGLSPYKTPYQLFLEKTGIIQDDEEENKFQYWGTRLEPIIREEFALRNNVKIDTPDTIIHPFYDYMRANIDGFISDWNSVLEIKCASSYAKDMWGDHGTDVIPLSYLTQVAHYVSSTNSDSAHIAVLIGGNDYREFKYTRDMELECRIIDAAKEFWRCVQENISPPATSPVDLKLMYPKSDPLKSILINDSTQIHLKKLNEIKNQIKELNTKLEDSKLEIMKYMADSTCLSDADGKPLVTWRESKKGSRIFLTKGDE